MTLTGHCFCGRLEYELSAPLGPVVHCHCAFCRRIHGAAFTTVALIPAAAIRWSPSSGIPATFETPLGNIRHFCGGCATPIWNFAPPIECGVVVVGSLAPEDQPSAWFHVNTESMAPWFTIQDALPRFRGWPNAQELRRLCSDHEGAWIPEPLFPSIA